MAQETPAGEGGEVRRKALIRLAVAATVTALALTGLWWLDKSGKAAKPIQKTAPSAITTAPPAPPAAPEPEPPAAPEPALPLPDAGKAATTVPAAPPPPRVEAAPARPAPPAETKPARPPADTRTAAPSPPPPAASPIRPQAADAGGRGAYTLQLGVFSNPANAQEMLERLRRQGVHAYLETRVLVGPFADRNEAQRAHAELKRMGISGLLSRPAASQ